MAYVSKLIKWKTLSQRIQDPPSIIMIISIILATYYLLYAVLRLKIDNWNDRSSKLSTINWQEDPLLDRVHSDCNNWNSTKITLVTAYFELKMFQKGNELRSSKEYFEWIDAFGRLQNDLIVFTDSTSFASLIGELRQHLPKNKTKIFSVHKSQFKAFKLAPKIKEVFAQPGYPKHYPDTTNELYVACMHAKYEILEKVISENLTKKYVAWVDIGYFRHSLHQENKFTLDLPANFDETKISLNQIHSNDQKKSVEYIIRNGLVWVGGGLLLGKTDVVLVFVRDYQVIINKLLDLKWMASDQQILYCMYVPDFPIKPRIEIQVYYTLTILGDWFHLGNTMKEKSDQIYRKSKSILSYYLEII